MISLTLCTKTAVFHDSTLSLQYQGLRDVGVCFSKVQDENKKKKLYKRGIRARAGAHARVGLKFCKNFKGLDIPQNFRTKSGNHQ